MREFNVLPKVQDFELNMVEKTIGEKIPQLVRNYIKKYGGDMILEKYFIDKQGVTWELNQFTLFKDLHGLTEEFLQIFKRRLRPFGFDPGGWHFCLCMDEIDYGAVIVNRWTDFSEEQQFIKIAN